jgi:hypothetical protein
VIGAGAKVLGAITIGEGSRIGSNAVVVKDVPPNSVVVGVPGQVVVRSHPSTHQPDFNHNMLPDTIGVSLEALMERVSLLEKKVNMPVLELPVLVYSAEGRNGDGRNLEGSNGNDKGKGNGNGNGNGNGKGNGNGNGSSKKEEHAYPHAPDHGLWRGEDFMI